MFKIYNNKEYYSFSGIRRIPFDKMGESELIEALTPKNGDFRFPEKISFQELDMIKSHPAVENTECLGKYNLSGSRYEIKFKRGNEVWVDACFPVNIYIPLTAEEIMGYNGFGMSEAHFAKVADSEDVKEIRRIFTKNNNFCERWQPEQFRKYEIILMDGRCSTINVHS